MITNLLCIIVGVFGLITTFLILGSYQSNRIMNLYFILLIPIISLRHLLVGMIYFIPETDFKNTFYLYSNFAIFVFPLFYLYFKNLTLNNKVLNSSELVHFIFPTVFFVFLIGFNTYQYYSIRFVFVFYIVFFFFALLYTVLCYKILKKNIWTRKSDIKLIKKQNELIKKWTLFLFIAIALMTIRLLATILLKIYDNEYEKNLNFQWISSLIGLFILLKILKSPEILYGYDLLYQKTKENRNTCLVFDEVWSINPSSELNNSQHLFLKEVLDKKNIMNYIAQIEKLSFEHELFRDPNLKIADIANKLNIPKSHISYIFKYHANISFSEYKKAIRIHDAIKHIEQDYLKSNTLDSLSKKVGFTSYNPFFTSFKEISGISPLEYYKNLEIE